MNCSGWPLEGSVAAAIEGRGTDGGGGALQLIDGPRMDCVTFDRRILATLEQQDIAREGSLYSEVMK